MVKVFKVGKVVNVVKVVKVVKGVRVGKVEEVVRGVKEATSGGTCGIESRWLTYAPQQRRRFLTLMWRARGHWPCPRLRREHGPQFSQSLDQLLTFE